MSPFYGIGKNALQLIKLDMPASAVPYAAESMRKGARAGGQNVISGVCATVATSCSRLAGRDQCGAWTLHSRWQQWHIVCSCFFNAKQNYVCKVFIIELGE
jgi:hypothetical protein